PTRTRSTHQRRRGGCSSSCTTVSPGSARRGTSSTRTCRTTCARTSTTSPACSAPCTHSTATPRCSTSDRSVALLGAPSPPPQPRAVDLAARQQRHLCLGQTEHAPRHLVVREPLAQLRQHVLLVDDRVLRRDDHERDDLATFGVVEPDHERPVVREHVAQHGLDLARRQDRKSTRLNSSHVKSS